MALLDPFNPSCLGAKIPDAATLPSVPTSDVENFDLATTTAGQSGCWAFTPNYNNAVIAATSGAGSWAWGANFSGQSSRTKRSSYVATYELDRPVSHAVRISSQVAPLNATGFVHVAIAFESHLRQPTWQWPTTTAGLSGYPYYRRMTLASLTQSPFTIVNKFCDETAFRYSDANIWSGSAGTGAGGVGNITGDPSGYTAGQNQFHVPRSWGTILIAFEGAPSTIALSVEHLLMTEAIPRSDAPLSGTQAASQSSATIAGASHMSANTEVGHTEDQQESFIASGLGAFAQGAAERAGQVVNDVIAEVNPAMRRMGAWSIDQVLGMSRNDGIAGVNNADRLTNS